MQLIGTFWGSESCALSFAEVEVRFKVEGELEGAPPDPWKGQVSQREAADKCSLQLLGHEVAAEYAGAEAGRL